MLDVEEHPRPGSRVALVHQHRATFEQVAVTFEREVDDRIEQRMTRADEGGRARPCGATRSFSKAIRS